MTDIQEHLLASSSHSKVWNYESDLWLSIERQVFVTLEPKKVRVVLQAIHAS